MHVFLCVYVYERHREFSTAVQEQEWSRGGDGRGGQRARSQMPVSSVGEDRAILLGFTMMAFSVLMFFVVGITMVKPFVNRYTVVCRVMPEMMLFLLFLSSYYLFKLTKTMVVHLGLQLTFLNIELSGEIFCD